MTDEVLTELGLKREDLREEKAVEVGNIFTLGYKFSEALGLKFIDRDGVEKPVFMGSYGIGPSRVMGMIAEHFSDYKGLVWSENVAPAKVYLVQIGDRSKQLAEEIYKELQAKGIEVLFDDREVRPGQKFADAELMGIPYRVTVSDRLMESDSFELVERVSGELKILNRDELLEKLA